MIGEIELELLDAGLDDWLYLAEVPSVVSSRTGITEEEALVEASIRVISTLLHEGLMQVGDVTSEGFTPWDLPAETAVRTIKQKWLEFDRRLIPGDVCWLSNTPQGDEVARSISLDDGADAEVPGADGS